MTAFCTVISSEHNLPKKSVDSPGSIVTGVGLDVIVSQETDSEILKTLRSAPPTFSIVNVFVLHLLGDNVSDHEVGIITILVDSPSMVFR